MREKLRMDIEDPRWEKSITDRENTEPRRAKPNRDIALPKRTMLRIEIDEPS